MLFSQAGYGAKIIINPLFCQQLTTQTNEKVLGLYWSMAAVFCFYSAWWDLPVMTWISPLAPPGFLGVTVHVVILIVSN